MQPISENDRSPRLAGPASAFGSPAPRTWNSVSACLQHDHRVMDAILTDAAAFVQEGELGVAAQYFAHFRTRLAIHMEIEESLVFPAYELASGCTGPTTVMRREHEGIRRLLQALDAILLGENSSGEPLVLLEELARLLDNHDEKEERVIYPAVDASTGAGELDALVARIEAFIERGRE